MHSFYDDYHSDGYHQKHGGHEQHHNDEHGSSHHGKYHNDQHKDSHHNEQVHILHDYAHIICFLQHVVRRMHVYVCVK